jgi:hypothetical protein
VQGGTSPISLFFFVNELLHLVLVLPNGAALHSLVGYTASIVARWSPCLGFNRKLGCSFPCLAAEKFFISTQINQ